MKLQSILRAVSARPEAVSRMGTIKSFFANQRAGGCVFYSMTLAAIFATGYLIPLKSVNWLFNKSIDGVKTAVKDSS